MSNDPYFEREQVKYENPVASREHLLTLIQEANQALSFLDICHLANATSDAEQVGIQRRLRAMEREGQLQFNRQKKYELLAAEAVMVGRVIGHRDGFGFVSFSSDEPDWYLSQGQMQQLMHGDEVEVVSKGSGRKGKTEGRVTRVIKPREESIVGRYFTEHGVGLVIPDDQRIGHEIYIGVKDTLGARQGNVVVVQVTKRPSRQSSAVGKIIEVLGEHMAPGMEIEMALRTYDIPHVWPPAVTKQAKAYGESVPEEAKVGRVDLRDLPLVTIDGEDARDFDDAVFCQPICKEDIVTGYELYVAIADVSYYVRPGTALDQEAINRGTSVYFPEQVIPMLPEALSNGLCSLNPDVERLCMVAQMQVDLTGQVTQFEFYEALMRSHARLTYNKVAGILSGDEVLVERYSAFVEDLKHLEDIYRILKGARDGRGAIEFETRETKFVFNADRKIEHIVPLVRNDAHKLIEECMILANVCAARLLTKNKALGLYRVHDKPDSDRLLSFTTYLNEVGVAHQLEAEPSARAFTRIMHKIQARPDAEVIQSMLLRSMKQAQYDCENIGHFGLALEEYAHFTSPIRRYPDLVVHRAIKAVLKAQKKATTGAKKYVLEEVEQLGEQCSMAERRADEATRDVADWLKCEFMQDHVGDVFPAVVSSVTNFGLFVRLLEFGIDGLVHVTALGNDYYHFDDVRQALVGEASGRVFRLGDKLEVKVASVNLDERKIDLILDEAIPKAGKKPRKAKRAKSKDTKNDGVARASKGQKRKQSTREKKKQKASKRNKKR
ncbi:MAG: ribonuclease R [Alteromonadaceae bacterium]|nr:ribonuclease R [Alteromonadaceae bacterium]